MLELGIRTFRDERRELPALEEWFRTVQPLPCLQSDAHLWVSAQVRAEVESFLATLDDPGEERADGTAAWRRAGFRYRAVLAVASAGVVIVPAAVFGGAGLAANSISDIINSTSNIFTSSNGGGQATGTAQSSLSVTSTTLQSSAAGPQPTSSTTTGDANQGSPPPPPVAWNQGNQASSLVQNLLESITVQLPPATQGGTGGGGNVSNQVASQGTSSSAVQVGSGAASSVNHQTSTLTQQTTSPTSTRGPSTPSLTNPPAPAPSSSPSTGPDVTQQVQTAIQQVQTAVQNTVTAPTNPGASVPELGTTGAPNVGSLSQSPPTQVGGPSTSVTQQSTSITQQSGGSTASQAASPSQTSQSTAIQTQLPVGP